MIRNYIENANFEDTGFSYTMVADFRQAQNGDSLLFDGV